MTHVALHSWGGGGERLVSLELDMNCPAEKALMWLTLLSSLSSPLQLARWQVHVEKRDNQLPSPLFIFPVSSCLLYVIHRLSFLALSLSFLTIVPFIPCLASHCLLLTFPFSFHIPTFSLFHCSKPTVRPTKRETEATCHLGCEELLCFPRRPSSKNLSVKSIIIHLWVI